MKALFRTGAIALISFGLYACQMTPDTDSIAQAPSAEKRPSERTYHGKTLEDDYLWLKDTSYPVIDDPDILDYLQRENLWYQQQMASREDLVNTLFEEMKGRTEEERSAVPWRDGAYIYRWRYIAGSEYRLWERKPVEGGDYVTILDESLEAEGLEFFSRGNFLVSPNGRMLAWSADRDGSERQKLFVDDLVSGRRYDDGLDKVSAGDIAWGTDNESLLYMPFEDDGWYRQRVRVHRVGSSHKKDTEVFYNPDRRLDLSLGESQSREYILIQLNDLTKSETYYLRTSDTTATPTVISPMRDDHYYSVDHGHGRFYIRSNDRHINFRIVTASEADPTEGNWQELLPASDEVYYQDMALLSNFVAVEEVSEGLKRIRIHAVDGKEHHVQFPEEAYTASLGDNPSIDAEFLRIDYESMITPETVYDYRPDSKKLELRQQQEIPSGYDKQNYVTTRLWATARDKVLVPVSVVHHKSISPDGSAPVLLYGYGAYSYGEYPNFSSKRLSLLDRGVVYAIAHVRGGDELGYQWYLDGKLEKRTNTFNDFVDAGRYLSANGYGTESGIAIMGGSAGGELVGAAVIQAPELWRAAVLEVPFVDVLNTILDASLPLTPPEWPEWGNPIESPEAFELIRSYSPYDNIEARDYPPMLVSGGLNDPRVTYWEPAKWTAKMRALKTDDNELIMHINMGAGHQGKTGRYTALHEVAEVYAFILSHLDADDTGIDN